VKNNEPEVFQLVRHVLLPSSFVNHYLTGRYCIEVSHDVPCPAGFRVETVRHWR
jgi:hypothetical protein